MKHESKLTTSIKLLKEKGWKVEKTVKGDYLAYLGTDSPNYHKYHLYDIRELIHLANTYTKNNKQKTSIKKSTKTESKRERAFVRDELHKFGEDSDTNHPKTKFSDTWNWD
jgi:hypothetical protein